MSQKAKSTISTHLVLDVGTERDASKIENQQAHLLNAVGMETMSQKAKINTLTFRMLLEWEKDVSKSEISNLNSPYA